MPDNYKWAGKERKGKARGKNVWDGLRGKDALVGIGDSLWIWKRVEMFQSSSSGNG